MKRNEFEDYVPVEIDIEKFELVEGTNKVMIMEYRSDVEQSVGGIITEGLDHYNWAEQTARRGKVIKTVNEIKPGQNGKDLMMRSCDVEIEPGDEVYFNYLDNINSFKYSCDDVIYKLIPYSAIILAIRKEKVIMCNGYVLLEDMPKEIMVGSLVIPQFGKEREGIVKHIGKGSDKHYKVVNYNDYTHYLEQNPDKKIYALKDGGMLINNPDRTDNGSRIIKEGDHVLIDDLSWRFALEAYAYARFDDRKIYTVCPVHCIVAILVD